MSDMVNYIGEVAILCTKISIYVIVYNKYGHCIEMLLIYTLECGVQMVLIAIPLYGIHNSI